MTYKNMPLNEAFWFQEGPGIRNWQFTKDGVKLLNVSNICKNGLIDLSKTDRHISYEEAYGKYSHFLIEKGDLVIASSGISIEDDGYLFTRASFINEEHLPLCMNTSTIRFKSIQGISDLNFLKHWFQTLEFRRQITKEVTGSAQKNFGPSHLKRLKITLPPLSEQRRIAAILDKAEALRAKRREAIAKLDQLLQSVFFEIFGDPVKNEKKWQKNNILEYCDFLTGYPFKSANFVERNSGIKICRGANVLPGYIDWSDEVNYPSECFEELNNFQLLDGDVIVAMDRPWISSGFKAILLRGVNEKILLVQRVARLRAKKKHYSSFIYKLICSQAFIQQCKPTETTIPHISPNDFRNFNIISPPEELIKKFHDFSEKIYSMKQKNEKSLKKLDHFAASLQDNFFN